MIIRQTPLDSLAPVFSLSFEPVITNPSGVSAAQHRDVHYPLATSATSYREYLVYGADLPVISSTSEPADALDLSDWPTVRRNPGINTVVTATFENARAASTEWRFDFSTTVGSAAKLPATSAEPGSYFAYSYAVVDAIAAAMTSNSMWDGSGNRAQTGVIPHAFLTGHVWDGGGGIAGINANSGRRFMAITPRHLFACGHYQYHPGNVLRWKDVNNNIVSRTVVRTVNVYTETVPPYAGAADMSITLLDSDLPESITILPIAGDWARGVYDITDTTYKLCQQAWGLVLYNNDGHIAPFCVEEKEDYSFSRSSFSFEGITFNRHETAGLAGGFPVNEMGTWEDSSIFDHVVHAGDSGSPFVIPVAGGWAYSGYISRNFMPNEATFNALIALIDARAVAAGEMVSPTGHTVTVAPDPTL